MAIRPRYAYFDEDGNARAMSQARYERVMDLHTREPFAELAGRRVRFLTLYVWIEDGVPVEVSRVEPSLVAFDDEGRLDRAEAERQLHAAVNLVEQAVFGTAEVGVVPAAARF